METSLRVCSTPRRNSGSDLLPEGLKTEVVTTKASKKWKFMQIRDRTQDLEGGKKSGVAQPGRDVQSAML